MNRKKHWSHWFKLNRKSVLITFLVTYSIIFLIPVALGVVFYVRTEATMREQSSKTNQAMLEQLKGILDGNHKEVEHLMLQVALNPKVKESVNRMSSLNSLSPYEYVELKNTLLGIKASSRFIYDFFIYFLDEGVIVTPSMKTDEAFFYQNQFSYPGLSLEAWKARMRSSFQYMRYFPSEAVLKDEDRIRMLTVQQTLPIEEKAHPSTALLILIDEQTIQDLFKNIELANSSHIYIVNNQGQIIVSSNKHNPEQAEEMLAHFHNNDFSYYSKSQGEEMILSHTLSSRTSWHYISVIPRSVYMSKIQTIKNWALGIGLTCFVIGFVAILYISKRQYDPLKQIMIALPQIKLATGGNEYFLIQKNLESALHEEKKVRELLDSQAPLIKANFLTRLLHGRIDASTLEAVSLKALDILREYEHVAAVVVSIDDILAFDDRNNEESWALARFIITNIGLDLIRTRHQGASVEIDINRLAFLICLNTVSEEEAARELNRIASEIQTFLHIRFKLELTIGVGGIRASLPLIHESYREALKALDFKIIEGSNSIIHYGELTTSDPSYFFPQEFESLLVNMVKSGEVERVEQLIDELLDTNLSSQTLTPAMSKYLFFDLITTLIKVMDVFNIKPGSIWAGDRLDPMQLYDECGTSEKMKKELIRAYSEVCLYLKTYRRPSTLHQAGQIKEYIEKHFGDGDLSLVSIGEAFGMKASYVSSFFRKHTGQNLIDYIAQIRVQEAKLLLQSTSLTVTQIAEKVGYANDVGFARMFKKFEGVTPGKYRDLQSVSLPES